jgi:upstream activation factor subunit UAF30
MANFSYGFTSDEVRLLKLVAAREKRDRCKADTKQRASLILRPMKVSWVLRAAIGIKEEAVPRIMVVKKLWNYIQTHKLQDKINRKQINCDERLEAVFGKKQVSIFEMIKIIGKHLS